MLLLFSPLLSLLLHVSLWTPLPTNNVSNEHNSNKNKENDDKDHNKEKSFPKVLEQILTFFASWTTPTKAPQQL